jgi:uncharacterized protein (DUF1800 family)
MLEAMAVSSSERVSHVVRRLSMGVHADVVAGLDDTEAAISTALDLSGPAPALLDVPPPADYQAGSVLTAIGPPIAWWFGRMASPDRMIEERLVWFWHDHFATSLAKVRVPYLMWKQHVTLREHATGSFADLLKALAKDPAIILYLDGITNAAQERNENFGRECLELFTMGRDAGYTQDDVIAASRAFTGWVVNVPGRFVERLGAPWDAGFVARRHMDGALDVILDHPSTAKFVSAKIYRELVGLEPVPATVDRLAKQFRRDYQIMPLVEDIVHDDAFASDDAVRAKYRTPVEKLVGILQATGTDAAGLGPGGPRQAGNRSVSTALRTMSFLPFVPPNVGGYPKGARLLGPHSLVHTFDLLQAITVPPSAREPVDDLFARFGIHDVSDRSHDVVTAEPNPATRLALVVTSPEYTLT